MKILINAIKFLQVFCVIVYAYIARPYHLFVYYFDRRAYYRAIHSSSKFILFCLGIRVSLFDPKNIPKPGGAYLIAANHQSYMDSNILSSLIPCVFIQRPVSYLPGISWHFGKMSLIIKRDSPASIIKAVRYVKKVAIDQQTPVVMFPESTRSVDGSLGNLRLGVATIAKNLKIPILPITIFNSREVLAKGKAIHDAGAVYVAAQKPIDGNYVQNHSVEEITGEIRARLQAGLDSIGQRI
ncbi:MAG: lysophospholipid acyltransferase family protein [Candidatus Margulisiibacteriota bacterium]|nr:lysophospholipid acyltransferase family protein [Candidatus Margulisiibacteriota bacterium]